MKYRIRTFILGMLIPVVVMTYYNAWYGGCREECKNKIIFEHYQDVIAEIEGGQVTRVTQKSHTPPPIPSRKPTPPEWVIENLEFQAQLEEALSY